MDELEPGGRPDAPEPGPSMLGDIVLCPQFAADQAAAAGHSLGQELALLTVHGVLHLLGYDHAEPDEEKEMFAPAAPTARGVGRRPGRGVPPGPPVREGPAAAGQVPILRRTVNNLGQLIGAIVLIGVAGLFAAIDAAISTVSIARVEELVRDERPGAVRLAKVMAERPRYINLVVLLRIACEVSATVAAGRLPRRLPRGELGPRLRGGDHDGGQLRRDRRRSEDGRQAERLFHLVVGRASAAGDFGGAHPGQPAAGA